MRLVSIEIVDVGPFGRFKADLSGNLVAVTGPNGSGKTTLLNAAYYAFTGDASRLGRRDAPALNRATPDQPHVRLVFRVPGSDEPAVVTRWLPDGSKPGRRRLSHAGRAWASDDEIARQVERWAGVGVKTFADFVFVGQGRLSDVVDDQPARRAEVLHRLFGLDRAERACKAVDEHLATLPAPPDDSVLAALRARAAEAESAYRKAAAELAAVPDPDPGVPACRELVARHQQQALASARRKAAVELSARAREALTAPEPPGPDRELVKSAGDALQGWAEYQLGEAALGHRRKALAEARARLAACEPPGGEPGPPPDPPVELVGLRERAQGLRAVAQAGPDSHCPVCAGPLSHVGAASRDAAAELLDRLCALEAGYSAACAAHASVRGAYVTRLERLTAAEAATVRAAADVAAAERGLGAPPPVSRAQAELVLAEGRRREQAAASFLAVRRRAESDLRWAEAELAAAPEPDVPVTDAELKDAQARLVAADQADRRRAELSARSGALEGARDAALALVERAEASHAAADRLAGYRSTLLAAKAILHHKAAPAVAAAACLADLTGDLNRRLGQLAAPFRVSVGDDGQLRAEFRTAGKSKSLKAELLSFGQKAVLAVAWRLAVQDRRASGVGVLCLDEPTHGLDSERVGALKSALGAWRPHGSDRQFVVVTHDRRLLGAFDTVVELGGR